MFFKNTFNRIENNLDDIKYLLTKKIKMECDHPCTSVYIRPGKFLRHGNVWVKVCKECNKEIDWYFTEMAYLRAKQILMAEIMKTDRERIKELEKG